MRADRNSRQDRLLKQYESKIWSLDVFRRKNDEIEKEVEGQIAELEDEISDLQGQKKRKAPVRQRSASWDPAQLERDMGRGSSVQPEGMDDGLGVGS